MKIRRLLVAFVLIIGAVLVFFASGKRIVLVADETIPVTLLPTGGNQIAVLSRGTSAGVSECEDLKHYIVPKVQLPDGSSGYVLTGRFHLVRRHAWDMNSGPLSHSCP